MTELHTRGKVRGFTLIEVMFALAVFAVAATALISAATQAVDTTFELRQRTQALLVAQNTLAEMQAYNKPTRVSTGRLERENFGRRWWVHWQAMDPESETWGPWLLRLTLDVRSAPEGPVRASLTTLSAADPE